MSCNEKKYTYMKNGLTTQNEMGKLFHAFHVVLANILKAVQARVWIDRPEQDHTLRAVNPEYARVLAKKVDDILFFVFLAQMEPVPKIMGSDFQDILVEPDCSSDEVVRLRGLRVKDKSFFDKVCGNLSRKLHARESLCNSRQTVEMSRCDRHGVVRIASL